MALSYREWFPGATAVRSRAVYNLPVPRILIILALTCSVLAGCRTVSPPPAETDSSGGTLRTSHGEIHWSRVARADGAYDILLVNQSERPLTCRISLPRQQVRSDTEYELRRTGTKDVEYCDPVTQECYVVEEAIYERVPVTVPVYADLSIDPARVNLDPGESATFRISRSDFQSDWEYEVAVTLIVGGVFGARGLVLIAFVN